MGFFDAGIRKARDRQKDSIIGEGQRAGSQAVHFGENAQDDASSANAAIGSSWKALAGGSSKVDAVQDFQFNVGGWPHYYLQPYSGMNPLPGEHHAWLAGSLPAAAVLERGGRWRAPSDPRLAEALSQHPQVATVAQQLAWDWQMGMTKVELAWTLQFRSVGDGRTHVVMQAGRFGGVTTYEVGFQVFVGFCGALHGWLRQEANPEQPLLAPAPLGILTGLYGSGPRAAPVHAESASGGMDYTATVTATLHPHVGKKVHLGNDVPAKKLSNLREHVLPADVAGESLVAVLDLTTFGSAKDALVVTRTQLIAKEMDHRVQFPLRALRAVTKEPGFGSTEVEVEVDGLGALRVPVGFSDEAVVALLQAIVGQNQAGGNQQAAVFVSDAPGGGVSMHEASELQQQVQAVLQADAVGEKINAAARLMTSKQFQACIVAYEAIAQQHPDQAATCHGQIGAAHFFLGNYEAALSHYQYAKQLGEDPEMMDDNIAEAQEALAKRR